jgi:TolB-like protein
MKTLKIALLFFLGFPILSRAQISVAIGDFENRTDYFYLDSWTRKIPEFLSSELSRSPEIVVVDRQRLKSVLDEQKLQDAGLTDSTKVLEIGKLLSAQYIITGTFSTSDEWLRIDARITSVSTGRMIGEKVASRSQKNLERMVSLLANNLMVRLTGSGEYRESVVLRKYPTRYFLGAALLSGAAAAFLDAAYHDKSAAYHRATRLDAFDPAYRSANRLYRGRTVALSLTAAAFAGAMFCFFHDLSPDRILANPLPVKPVLGVEEGEIRVGLRIAF